MLTIWVPCSVNSKSAFFILKAGAKHVEDGGKLITIVTALLAAFTGLYTSYAGSKAPVEHFTRGVAKELQGRNVSVNCVAPGPMDTREYRFGKRSDETLTDRDCCCSLLLPARGGTTPSPSTRARPWAAGSPRSRTLRPSSASCAPRVAGSRGRLSLPMAVTQPGSRACM